MDLKQRCFLGHNPKNDVDVAAATASSSSILGRHDRHNGRRHRDSDVGDDSEEENDADERKTELVDDSPNPSNSSPATLSPESDLDLHGPLHHHRILGPSLNLSPSPSPTTMITSSSSPSHHHIGSYSDSDEGGGGSANRSPISPHFPSSSSFRRDRSSSSIEEEGKAGMGNTGDEDKDSDLVASEREQVSEMISPSY